MFRKTSSRLHSAICTRIGAHESCNTAALGPCAQSVHNRNAACSTQAAALQRPREPTSCSASCHQNHSATRACPHVLLTEAQLGGRTAILTICALQEDSQHKVMPTLLATAPSAISLSRARGRFLRRASCQWGLQSLAQRVHALPVGSPLSLHTLGMNCMNAGRQSSAQRCEHWELATWRAHKSLRHSRGRPGHARLKNKLPHGSAQHVN